MIAQQNALAFLHALRAKSVVAHVNLDKVELLQARANNVQSSQGFLFGATGNDITHVGDCDAFEGLQVLGNLGGGSIVETLIAQTDMRRITHCNRTDQFLIVSVKFIGVHMIIRK